MIPNQSQGVKHYSNFWYFIKQSKNIIINKTITTTTTKKNILFFKLYKGSKKADSPII